MYNRLSPPGILGSRRDTFAKSTRKSKYPDDVRSLVQRLLQNSDVPRDSLPYTPAFESLKREYEKVRNEKIRDHDFWLLLTTIGKKGGLAKRGSRRRGSRAPILSEKEQFEILRYLPDGIGTRDYLPYTAKFKELQQRFVQSTGIDLNEHEFWRALSAVGKKAKKHKPVHETAPIGSLTGELARFLDDNNPWWRGKPMKEIPRFHRWAFHEVIGRLQGRLAPMVALRGSRRVGKSVVQNQLIEELLLSGRGDPTGKPVDPARILSVQFDDAPALGGISMPIQAIIQWYEEQVLKKTLNEAAREGRPAYLLFDEVQNLPDWSVQLKILADKNDARILVTGGSAMRIAKGQDNLAGRVTSIELAPLRLWEVAEIRGIHGLKPFAPSTQFEDWKKKEFWQGLVEHGSQHTDQRDEAFRQFSERGGYPLCQVQFEQRTELLRQQIISEVIDKTIEHDPGNKLHGTPLDSGFVREVFRMVCRYAGQPVQPKRFADELNQRFQTPVGNQKVSDAIQFLADTLLVHRIPPLELLQKGQASPSKLCVCDHFVRNGILQETTPLDPESLKHVDEAVATQAGHLIESVLGYFLKSIPGVEVAWFPKRTKEPEVDLVLTVGTNRIPIEVKYRRGRLDKSSLAGIESFCSKRAYGAPFGLVVTQSTEGPVGDRAIAIPASMFLLLR